MLRIIALALASVGLATLLVTVPSESSQAAGYYGYTRPASPGTGYAWGVPANKFQAVGTSVNTSVCEAKGGWLNLGQIVAAGSNMAAPATVRMSEPRWNGTAVVAYACVWSVQRPTGGTGSAAYSFGTASSTATTDTYVTCANSEWSLPSSFYRRSLGWLLTASTLGYGDNLGSANRLGTASTNVAVGTASCPYIVNINMRMQYYVHDPANPTTNGTQVTKYFVWGAEVAYQGLNKYTQTDPLKAACSTVLGVSISADCVYALNGQGIDPTDFATVCANAPQPVWLDFSWLPGFVGHYARCLFVPAAGWDWKNEVAPAWNASAWGGTAAAVSTLADSFRFAEACGVLSSPSGSPVWSQLVIDTCQWTPWATPIKSMLAISITVLGGILLLYRVTEIITGVLNRRTPNILPAPSSGPRFE